MKYTADFETTTIEPARVWLWAICSIDNPDMWYKGETIETFMKCCQLLHNPTLYFHNEKFDGNFIIYYLLKHGFTWVDDKRKAESNTFTTLISGDGIFYSIDIYFYKSGHKVNKCTVWDSMKLLNMSVAEIAKSFKLPILKERIDYATHNNGEPPTVEEWHYIKNDVQIPAMALKQMFDSGFTKMTASGNAFNNYREFIGVKRFDRLFPTLSIETDSKIRTAYRGGFTYANPVNCNRDVYNVAGFDVNSLYPSVMAFRPLPYGEPIEFKGEYQKNNIYPLFIQHIRCMFELKENHIPTIQIKHSRFFLGTEYLKSSRNRSTGDHELVELSLSNPDFELFFKHYDVFNIEYLGGYMFRQSTELFREWVEHWTEEKIKAGKEHNAGKRQIAKLVMNSLYGRFALNPARKNKIPWLDSVKDIVRYKMQKYEVCDENGNVIKDKEGNPVTTDIKYTTPIYIPVGVFVTAWARYTTISASQKIHEDSIKQCGHSRYLYSDTDSIYVEGFEIPDGLEVDPFALGKWKLETKSERGRFLQAKRYILDVYEFYDDELTRHIKNGYGDLLTHYKITCAGMPEKSKQFVTWENFRQGATFDGKLKPTIVSGGVILTDIPFTLK